MDFSASLRYNQITDNNISLLEKFLSNELSSHFRYYKTRDMKECVKAHIYTVISTINDNLIAYGHLDYEKKYWLGICVLNEHQGKGYGGQMMEHLVSMAKTKRLSELNLTVDLDNIPAIGLYRKFNFVELNRGRCISMKCVIDKSDNSVPVSYGELIDKLTILDIKMEKLTDDRRVHVEKEFRILKDKANWMMNDTIQSYYSMLVKCNLSIWEMQDDFRNGVGDRTILCSEIIKENDRRFRIKNKINNLLESDIMEQKGYIKRKVFVLGHLGLGDNINMVGLVRYLATQYEEVKIVCKQKYLSNMELFFSDDKTITMYPANNDSDISPKFGFLSAKFRAITADYDVVKLGCHGNKEIYDLPFCFYNHGNVDARYFWEYFHIPDSRASDILYDAVRDRPYVIIHNSNSKGCIFSTISIEKHLGKSSDDILILNLDNNVYEKNHPDYAIAQRFVFQLLPYYKKALVHADALYLSDSSVFCMAINLEIITDKCYYITRKNNPRDYSYFYGDKYGPGEKLNRKVFKKLNL